MAIEHIGWAFKQQIPTEEKLVLIGLADKAEPDLGHVLELASYVIADWAGIHPTEIDGILTSLQERGKITIHHGRIDLNIK